MNNPSLREIVELISRAIDAGMSAYLNIDTGEVVTAFEGKFEDPAVSAEDLERAKSWPNMLYYPPVEDEDYEFLARYFIKECVREGTLLHKRLSRALNSTDYIHAFEAEIERCKGKRQWQKYYEDRLDDVVIDKMVKRMVGDNVKAVPIDDAAIEEMAKARISGCYCFCNSSCTQVVISHVVAQPSVDFDENDQEYDLETHYTLTELVTQVVENQIFHGKWGGGMIMEPYGYAEPEEEIPTLEEAIKRIHLAFRRCEAEVNEFETFCHDQQMTEDLFDNLNLDVELSDIEKDIFEYQTPQDGKMLTKKDRLSYDGMYPLPGRPDGEFTDEDPTGMDRLIHRLRRRASQEDEE